MVGGLLKYYRREVKATGRGEDLKGQLGVCGLSIMRAAESAGAGRYVLKSPTEKEGRELEFENEAQAEEWIKALQGAVYGANHAALAQGCRTPEVTRLAAALPLSLTDRGLPASAPDSCLCLCLCLQVVEWYYWMESSFLELARELDAEREFFLTYELDGFAHVSTVMLSVGAVPCRSVLRAACCPDVCNRRPCCCVCLCLRSCPRIAWAC